MQAADVGIRLDGMAVIELKAIVKMAGKRDHDGGQKK